MDVLVIHPDQKLCGELERLLRREGWTPWCASTIQESISILRDRQIPVVVLDSRYATRQGFLERLDGQPSLPIILPISGDQEKGVRLANLSPFRGLEPLLAVLGRIRGALEAADNPIHVGEMLVDPLRKQVRFRDRWFKFPPLQFQIVHYLAQNAGRAVGFRELLHHIWGYNTDDPEAREPLKSQIRLIRRRLGLSAKEPEYLESVRGFGYILIDPESSEDY
jgi:DNA-binding response OmpR family regulator